MTHFLLPLDILKCHHNYMKSIFTSLVRFIPLLIYISLQTPVQASPTEEWKEGIPEKKTCERKEISKNHLIEAPIPSSSAPRFSRSPQIPYFDSNSGKLIVEYILPPLCRDGVASFIIESYELSDDGRKLIVTKQKVQAPTSNNSVRCESHRYISHSPYVFSVRGKLLIFKNRNSIILSCDEFMLEQGKVSPKFIRRIYPSEKSQYGILSL